MMHFGRLDNPSTGEGRVYAFLRDHAGQWFTLRELNRGAGVEVATTYLSGVRHQLPPWERLERDHRMCADGKKRYHHRLVIEPRQMTFQIPLDVNVTEG
jgi:hypothetical protein